jgi:hypothetical protein
VPPMNPEAAFRAATYNARLLEGRELETGY